ncbi:Crp/Fnr family transcriptional regulator [Streptomyces sp. NPDC002623]
MMATVPMGVTGDVRRASLLDELPEPVVRDFLKRALLVTFPPRNTVFQAGDPTRVHLVISGRVKISRRGEHGRENILVIAGPGELLGSLDLFDPRPQPTTAVTLGPARIAELSTESMLEWLAAHTGAAMRFIHLLVLRAQRQNDALHDVFGLDVGTRLARAILREAQRFGRRTPEGIRVDLGLSQEELALHVRASRESVNQSLAGFARQGWVRRDGCEIVVLDEKQLAHHAKHEPQARTTERRGPSKTSVANYTPASGHLPLRAGSQRQVGPRPRTSEGETTMHGVPGGRLSATEVRA